MDVDNPYTLDDLDTAMRDRADARDRLRSADTRVEVARNAMTSHQREADLIKTELERHEARVRKIIHALKAHFVSE